MQVRDNLKAGCHKHEDENILKFKIMFFNLMLLD